VAILAAGQLVTSGRLDDILAFEVRGWEIVVDGVTPGLIERLGFRVTKATRIAEGRYSIDIPSDASPDRVIAALAGAGARLVSLAPLRATLEEVFVKEVSGRARPPLVAANG
jgi:hypothetical protein